MEKLIHLEYYTYFLPCSVSLLLTAGHSNDVQMNAHYMQEDVLPNSLLVPSILEEKSIVSLTVISAW
jgi:hypothetical protein